MSISSLFSFFLSFSASFSSSLLIFFLLHPYSFSPALLLLYSLTSLSPLPFLPLHPVFNHPLFSSSTIPPYPSLSPTCLPQLASPLCSSLPPQTSHASTPCSTTRTCRRSRSTLRWCTWTLLASRRGLLPFQAGRFQLSSLQPLTNGSP